MRQVYYFTNIYFVYITIFISHPEKFESYISVAEGPIRNNNKIYTL